MAATQTAFRFSTEPWFPVRDGDLRLRSFYNRHYSSRGSASPLIAGPGQKLILLTPAIDALFVWRKFRDMRNEEGINCAVFRNEGPRRASDLIQAAEHWARDRWGRIWAYTYVDAAAVRSLNPGYCFKRAGWVRCAITPGGHGRPRLHVLEKML